MLQKLLGARQEYSTACATLGKAESLNEYQAQDRSSLKPGPLLFHGTPTPQRMQGNEAAAERSLVRENSSVLTPVVLDTALRQLCRMTSNWEYRLPSSSPITQQRQGKSSTAGTVSRKGQQFLPAPAHRSSTSEMRTELVDSGGAGQLLLTLHSPPASQGQTMQCQRGQRGLGTSCAAPASQGLPCWSAASISHHSPEEATLVQHYSVSFGTKHSYYTGRCKRQVGGGCRAQTQPCQQFAVLLPTSRTTTSLETAQDRNQMDRSSCWAPQCAARHIALPEQQEEHSFTPAPSPNMQVYLETLSK